MGIDTKTRSQQVISMVEAEMSDIELFFFGDVNQEVMVGCLTDPTCNQCYVGQHCFKKEDVNGDSLFAKKIKRVCDLLNVPCNLIDSPDEIYENDGKGNWTKGKVATLKLGDLRDFVLRRLIYCPEEYLRLTTIYNQFKNQLIIEKGNIEYDQLTTYEQQRLVKLSTDRLLILDANLMWVNILPHEEISLQNRILQKRNTP